jgi:hypothetical protein
LAHIGQRFGVDDAVAVTCALQFEEVAAALGASGAEPGKMGARNLTRAPWESYNRTAATGFALLPIGNRMCMIFQ